MKSCGSGGDLEQAQRNGKAAPGRKASYLSLYGFDYSRF